MSDRLRWVKPRSGGYESRNSGVEVKPPTPSGRGAASASDWRGEIFRLKEFYDALESKRREPRATVIRCARWLWIIRVDHGGYMKAYAETFGSRNHADRKARRMLARYLRKREAQSETWTITEP